MAIQPENSRVTPTEHKFNIKSVLQKSYLKGKAWFSIVQQWFLFANIQRLEDSKGILARVLIQYRKTRVLNLMLAFSGVVPNCRMGGRLQKLSSSKWTSSMLGDPHVGRAYCWTNVRSWCTLYTTIWVNYVRSELQGQFILEPKKEPMVVLLVNAILKSSWGKYWEIIASNSFLNFSDWDPKYGIAACIFFCSHVRTSAVGYTVFLTILLISR